MLLYLIDLDLAENSIQTMFLPFQSAFCVHTKILLHLEPRNRSNFLTAAEETFKKASTHSSNVTEHFTEYGKTLDQSDRTKGSHKLLPNVKSIINSQRLGLEWRECIAMAWKKREGWANAYRDSIRIRSVKKYSWEHIECRHNVAYCIFLRPWGQAAHRKIYK